MKWEYSIASNIGVADGYGNITNLRPEDASENELGSILTKLGDIGWELVGLVNGNLVFKRPRAAGDVDPARPGYQGQMNPNEQEKVLWVWKHQQPVMTFGDGGRPVPTFADCTHLFDAALVEEHEAACKVVLLTGSEHGGGVPGTAMWVDRKDLRFVGRGASVPELDGDPENQALRRLIDGEA